MLAMVASMLVSMVGVASASDQFTDVDDSHTFHDEISWLAERGVTTGWEDSNTFGPALPVSRQAMVTFLYRMAGEPQGNYSEDFTDVSEEENAQFYDAIAWAATNEITKGYEDDTFRPEDPVKRMAFAAFLFRAVNPPAADWDSNFDDVNEGHPFYKAISWMAEEGITTGWPDNTFRPGQDVTRMATAAFLFRVDQAGLEIDPGPITFQEPTITNAVLATDVVATDVATASDVWELEFSEEMASDVVTTGVFDLQDEDGDVIRVVCGDDADVDTTDATCVLTDGGDAAVDNDHLEITLDEAAVDRNPGTGGDDVIEYPLTIIDTQNVIDEDNRVEVDLAASADVVIDIES